MGPNVSIFMGVMEIKCIRTKCNLGTKCHTVGLAKNAGGGMFTCDILSLKVFKIESSGVDQQSVQLEINVPVEVEKPRTICWMNVLRGWKCY